MCLFLGCHCNDGQALDDHETFIRTDGLCWTSDRYTVLEEQ